MIAFVCLDKSLFPKMQPTPRNRGGRASSGRVASREQTGESPRFHKTSSTAVGAAGGQSEHLARALGHPTGSRHWDRVVSRSPLNRYKLSNPSASSTAFSDHQPWASEEVCADGRTGRRETNGSSLVLLAHF